MSELSQLSLLVVYAAMASYTIALVAFAIDLSALRSRRDAEGRVIRERVLVPAGGSARRDGGADAPAEGPAAGAGEAAAGGERRRRAAGLAMSTSLLGAAFHGIGVVTRALAAGHVPWSNMYEFSLTFTFVALALYLWLARSRDLRYLGAFVVGPVLLLLGVAVAVLYVEADGLEPILDNYWLYLHVSVAVLAIAVLTLAAVLAVLQLAKDFGGSSRWAAILSGLPDAVSLERLSYRFTAVGFVLWTFTLVAGAIWAEHAWGRAWGWDAKEVWTFVIWVIYAAYLHARATRGWDGRRAAYLVIAGFAAIMANYFVVNFLLSTKHGYAF
ncbi:MAG: c-type cytochrome biogenesis protein CcsB, partial [Actinomycetes bacterium]|nr:c-type cytochrome biogenesis protein CcsB [Actinomycetes bacterium]MDX5381300.1 c-type cytochrome biogenesis protein CcsB [Actinomycetes bacterium]MDX5400680.1 c-type cytochrome biogenesis protein CcsB [Actinomycetes bacterium]MDX5451077.1 c-type cytochrome biogenesis protein CcsB [Actinomycetes bacterium]